MVGLSRRRVALGAWLAVLVAVGPAWLRFTSMTERMVLAGILGIAGILLAAWAVRRGRHALVGLIATVAATGVGEVVLEQRLPAAGRTITSNDHNRLFDHDPRIGWRFRPGADERVITPDYGQRVRINSAGFRDVEPTAATGNRHTVLVLGDSFVSNLGVPLEQVFTRVLERRLGPGIEVRNHGVNGYGQVQQLMLLEELLVKDDPALVLIVVYARNDFDDNLGLFDWIRGYRRPRSTETRSGGIELKRAGRPSPARTGLFARCCGNLRATAWHRVLRQALARRQLDRLPAHSRPPELRYCAHRHGARERQGVEMTGRLLARMAELAGEHGARAAVVIAPSAWQADAARWAALLEYYRLDPEDFDRERPQASIATACHRASIPCLDLLPVLEQFTGRGESLYYPREAHWTALGNRRVAESIEEWLVDEVGLP